MTDIKEKALRTREWLYNSGKERNEIAQETKGQNETRTWCHVQKPRITASQYKRCFIKANNKPNKSYFRGAYLYQASTN